MPYIIFLQNRELPEDEVRRWSAHAADCSLFQGVHDHQWPAVKENRLWFIPKVCFSGWGMTNTRRNPLWWLWLPCLSQDPLSQGLQGSIILSHCQCGCWKSGEDVRETSDVFSSNPHSGKWIIIPSQSLVYLSSGVCIWLDRSEHEGVDTHICLWRWKFSLTR
jgi:hypothetical protein